jgi:hypothetical protein
MVLPSRERQAAPPPSARETSLFSECYGLWCNFMLPGDVPKSSGGKQLGAFWEPIGPLWLCFVRAPSVEDSYVLPKKPNWVGSKLRLALARFVLRTTNNAGTMAKVQCWSKVSLTLRQPDGLSGSC